MPVVESAPRLPLPLPLQLGLVAHEQPGDREVEEVRRRLRDGEFYDARAQINFTDGGVPWIRAGQRGSTSPTYTFDRWAGQEDSDGSCGFGC